MTTKNFDLNIEEVLENWETHHAIREIIANALDEQILSNSKEIDIFRDNERNWHIRDYGRGIKIEDFTLNENLEKINNTTGVIGKFGVGLKDALATFHRRRVEVLIKSSHGTFRLKQEKKHGFDSIITLHVEYDDIPNEITGTEFIFDGVSDQEIERARDLFLKFSDEIIIEENSFGQIFEKTEKNTRVYILGVLASEEPNFLFTYNITNLTESIRRKLNRERLNVGRSTYTERVKAILKNAESEIVKSSLISEVKKRSLGIQCDEMGWIEVSQRAINLMNEAKNVVFFTEDELRLLPNVMHQATESRFDVVVITDQQKEKLDKQAITGGVKVNTVDAFIEVINNDFQYNFIEYDHLSEKEKFIFDHTSKIVELVCGRTYQKPKILISETIRISINNTEGVFDPELNAIIIRRDCLCSLEKYASIVLHELAHKVSGYHDCSLQFENVLTDFLGKLAFTAISNQDKNKKIFF